LLVCVPHLTSFVALIAVPAARRLSRKLQAPGSSYGPTGKMGTPRVYYYGKR